MRTLALLLLSTSLATAAELPVRAVTLSSASLAEIVRAGPVTGDTTITLRAPLSAIDDLLKSLVVVDPAGRVEAIRLPAQDLAAEAFRGLPLKPEDFANRVALMGALRGQMVEAGGATGRIAEAEEIEAGLRLTLVTDTGIRAVVLAAGEAAKLSDPDLAARVARAAAALAAARLADERELSLVLRAPAGAAREVTILSVVGAPVWKPSYRLIVPEGRGDARLQGMAVIENFSGADWTNVRLSLVSGNPAAFRQALFTPVVLPRPIMPLAVGEVVQARPDSGPRPVPPAMAQAESAARGRALPAPMAMAAPAPPPPPQPMQDSMAGIAATETAATPGRIAFTLANPVTVAAGETASVPFLDARLPAERLWWVQDATSPHPLAAVRIRNATGAVLPAALATLFGGEGRELGVYLGDAQLPPTPDGETRLLAFARDRDVILARAVNSASRPIKVAVQRGRVVLTSLNTDTTSLGIDPRGRRGNVIIDMPRRDGWTPSFAVASQGDFGLRHEAAVDGARTTLDLAYTREADQVLPLWDQALRPIDTLDWRAMTAEAELRRLPGAPGTLERLREILARLPANAPGRASLEAVIEDMAAVRGLFDAWRNAARSYATANAALERARQAAEDRSGAARDDARRALNLASVAAERAGTDADTAWAAWRRRTEAMLAREQ
jgi:hypothetical protein